MASRKIASILTLVMSLGGVVGCAVQGPDGESDDELAITAAQARDEAEGISENFDPALAATIAMSKRASIDDGVVPQFASCGTPGSTAVSEQVNDAAFQGAAKQRSGSSTSCTAPGALQPTDDARYFCFTWEVEFTVSWTYLENLRTHVRGWTRDDLLRPPPGAVIGGARNRCPGL
jgi:hypothetical protein